jgi:Tfp pilus assembly protein PilO
MEGFRKRFVILLITSFSLFLIFGFLFIYFLKDINKTVKQADTYKTEIEQRASILDRIQTLDRESQEASVYTNVLQTALPSETEAIYLESQLKNIASNYNLSLSFRFGNLNPAQEGEPKSYSFNLVVSGKESGLINWLDDFQKLPYSFHLEQIEVVQISPASSQTTIVRGRQQTTTSEASYNIKILGKIYLR